MPQRSRTFHYHRCPDPKCDRVWAHDPLGDGYRAGTFDDMHRCPDCQCYESWKCHSVTLSEKRKANREYRESLKTRAESIS